MTGGSFGKRDGKIHGLPKAKRGAVLLDGFFALALFRRDFGFGGDTCFSRGFSFLIGFGFERLRILIRGDLDFLLLVVRVVSGDALHALFEAAQTFAETLAEFRQLLAAEQQHRKAGNDDDVPRLKESAHSSSPWQLGAR